MSKKVNAIFGVAIGFLIIWLFVENEKKKKKSLNLKAKLMDTKI